MAITAARQLRSFVVQSRFSGKPSFRARYLHAPVGLTEAMRLSHTNGMKVAVSISDQIFVEAEALAKRLKSSRSEIYSRALGEFIGHHAPDRVTDLMNDVVREVGPEADGFSVAAGRRVLKKTEW